jgi:NAD-dependent dihydropyrimidine dehydrogenase PreA subunit
MDPKELLGGLDRSLVHWHPKIDKSKCTKCMSCVDFCKHGVYEIHDDEPLVVNLSNCVLLCDNCRPVCPNSAISFPTTTELFKEVRDIRKKMDYVE